MTMIVQRILSPLLILMVLFASFDLSVQANDEMLLAAKLLEVGLDGALIQSISQSEPQMNRGGEQVGAYVLMDEEIDSTQLDSDEGFLECRDVHKDCELWESMGECDAIKGNPGYMYHHCPKTCGLCGKGDIHALLRHVIDSKNEDLAILGWGEEQEVHEQHREGIELLLEEVKRYMLEEINVDVKYESYKTQCQNRHFDCTLWALQGEVSPYKPSASYADWLFTFRLFLYLPTVCLPCLP